MMDAATIDRLVGIRDRARERREALAQYHQERAEQRRHEQVYNIGVWIARYEAARQALTV